MSVINCAVTVMVAADQNINDKVVGAIKTKVYKFDIALLVSGGHRRRNLVVAQSRLCCGPIAPKHP